MEDEGAKKILIVDDEPDVVESLTMALATAGYDIMSAGSAEEGLAEVRAGRPDLVLLDVMMPAGTEGFHFVWNLRKEPEAALRDLPIIMLTSIHQESPMRFYPEQSDGTYEPYEYLPVQAFLDKPVRLEKLLSEVQRLLAADQGGS